MTLHLTLLRTPSGVDVAPEITLDESGGSLGRGEDNHWVLPDPDKYLSAQHCHFFYQDNRWWVADTSTNGIYLNSAPLPLGRNRTQPLGDGDTLDMGQYRIRIGLATAPEGSNAPPTQPANAQPESGWLDRVKQWLGPTGD